MVFLASCDEDGNESYSYDIENDKFIPFFTNYESQFKLQSQNTKYNFDYFVIDNKNHALYILGYQIKNNNYKDCSSFILKVDISDLKNPKL